MRQFMLVISCIYNHPTTFPQSKSAVFSFWKFPQLCLSRVGCDLRLRHMQEVENSGFWEKLPPCWQHLGLFSLIFADPSLLLLHVYLFPPNPRSIKLFEDMKKSKPVYEDEQKGRPPFFSSWERTSLKSPTPTQGPGEEFTNSRYFLEECRSWVIIRRSICECAHPWAR